VDIAELNSYGIGGLSPAMLRCVPLDSIRYIVGATGEGRRELRKDPTQALHYSNYIFIQSEEDVRTWLLSNKPNEDTLDVLVDCHRPSTPARPVIPLELRHRYIAPNTPSNSANALAGRNVNPAAQAKGKAIAMNGTKVCGSQNPQDSPLFLVGCLSSSSDVSNDFDWHRGRVVSMTSPVNQGGDSTGLGIPLSIKQQGMLNTYRIMKQIWSPTHDDKAQKRKV